MAVSPVNVFAAESAENMEPEVTEETEMHLKFSFGSMANI